MARLVSSLGSATIIFVLKVDETIPRCLIGDI